MDCSNFEKSKGFQSKIPVRAIKPPSRLPVPIANKENESRKSPIRPNPSAIKNVSTKAQANANSKAIPDPTSRKGLLSSQYTRYGGKDTVKTVTNRRLTNAANPTVNKKYISSELQTNIKATKVSIPPTNKKPLNKEIVTGNKKLTFAACRNQNEKPTRGKTIDNNRRCTNIKDSNLLNKKSTVVQRSIANRNIANVDKIETKRFTNFGFGINHKKELPVKQVIGKLPSKGSTHTNKPADNLNIKSTKSDLNNEKDVSFEQESECQFDFQDPPHSFGNTKEGFRINQTKELEVKQPNKKVPSGGSTFSNKAALNLNIKVTKADINFKQDDSFDEPNCPFDIQVPPHSVDNMKKDKNPFFQPNVEFVADERYRNQILFGQGISPDSKPQPVKNSLINDRPSFFLKSKTALRALEKLEEEGRRISMMRMSGLCPNSLSRPSRATKMDPIQTVLRALENVDLAAEDRRISAMKKNNIYMGSPRRDGSPMYKQQVDPYKTALKKIEALQMKRKAESTKKVTFSLEPSDSASNEIKWNEKLNTKSFCEVKVNDVIIEKKTEDKECAISKLEPKISSPKPHLSTNSSSDNMERNLPKSHYQDMLLRICGQAEAQNKSNKPNKSTACTDRLASVSNLNSLSTIKDGCSLPKSTIVSQNALKMGSNISDSVGPCFRTHNRITSSNLTSEDPRDSLYQPRPQTILESDTRRSTLSSYSLSTMKNKSSSPKPILLPQNATNISDSVGPCFRTHNRITSAVLASGDPRYSLHLSRPQPVLESDTRRSTLSSYTLSAMKKMDSFKNPNRFASSILASGDPRCSLLPQTNFESNAKRNALSRLCTPKPVSLYPNPCAGGSISPEFLCRRTSRIVSNAPISTPMVLRTLAANLEETLSPEQIASQEDVDEPVCQRLDFDEVEREGLLRVCESPNKIRKFPIQSIRTNQQVLDSLADEECSMILSIASFPVITERSVWNPVAQILTYGDDMHFVPVKLK